MIFIWLVGCEIKRPCSRNLMLSLKLPSVFHLDRVLVPAEECKDIVMYIPCCRTRILLEWLQCWFWVFFLSASIAFWNASLNSCTFSSVQFISVAQSCPIFATPWIAACQASLSITNSRSSLKLMSIELVMPSSYLSRRLLLLTPIPPNIRVFSNESTLRMRWPKYWSFSFSIIPSKEIPELISFRMDWLDLLAVPGTLKSLLQHHSSKASILRRSAFFTVQLSHSYMTTGKTIALTKQTFVGKVMSLLLNMLSRLVITFLPRSKHLLIS